MITRRIALLGSGQGSTARAVIDHAQNTADCPYTVAALICTAHTSGLVGLGAEYGIPTFVIPYHSAEQFATDCMAVLSAQQVGLLVLAGFLKLLPRQVILELGGQVINTHPALLPNYGGKGMYGIRVHQAVIQAGEERSGVTVHWVTDHYDEGAVIGQTTVPVYPSDSPQTLQQRVKAVEGGFLAACVERLVRGA